MVTRPPSTECDYGPEYVPLTIATFERILTYQNLTKKVSFQIPIPLPEYSDIAEFFSAIVAKEKLIEPFHNELYTELVEFIRNQLIAIEDSRADSCLDRLQDSVVHDAAARVGSRLEEQTECPQQPLVSKFGGYFQFIMRNSSAERLTLLMNKEVEMADQMRALVRARDWELESLKKECEALLATQADNDAHPHSLSRLNEKMRQVLGSYTCQIEALSDRQRKDYHKMVECIYEKDEVPVDLVDTISPEEMLICRSTSLALQHHLQEEHPLDESFTIYLGSQLKTMHNARLIARAKSLNGPLGGDPSARLHAAMCLYRRALSGVILLVDKNPLWHIQEMTELARACEMSTELHFDSLVRQLKDVEASTREANRWRNEQALLKAQQNDADSGLTFEVPSEMTPREESSLLVGDVYTTRHSNLDTFQVVFHLVGDSLLPTEEINSRHPCLNGLRNVIRICAQCGVTSINIPLLLVDQANESMTVSWCVKRAELVFKCVKGYLMEVCGSGWGSSAPGGPSLAHAPHYNINFVLPAGLAPSVHAQILAMFPTIYHLVPSKNVSS